METILSIAGKPGLYKLVSRGNRNLIVETIDETHKRIPAFATDRVTSLGDIAMYTDADEIALWKVFENVGKKEDCKESSLNYKKASAQECTTTLLRCCPTTTATVFTTAISRSCCSGTISSLRTATPTSRPSWLLLRAIT